MKKLSFFAAVTVGLMFTSCIKEPTSCLTSSSATATVDEEITFANCSEDAESYEWNFGDSSDVVVTETAAHSFASEGDFTVELTAFSKKEKKSTVATTKVTVSKSKTQMFSGTHKDGDVLVWNTIETSTYSYVVGQPIFDQKDTTAGDGETVSLFANGDFVIKDASGATTDNGTWAMNATETEVTLTFSDPAINPQVYTIVSLTDSYLEMTTTVTIVELANYKQYMDIRITLER